MSAQTLQPLPRVNGRHRDKALASARKQRAIELRTQGLSYQAIADAMGYTSRGTVYKIIRDARRPGCRTRSKNTDNSSLPGWTPCRTRCGTGQWQACRRSGVDSFTLHDLRHFYASGLIANGCDVVTVQRALGHARATTTLNTYAHLWPTAEDRTRAAASQLMSAAGADSLRTGEVT